MVREPGGGAAARSRRLRASVLDDQLPRHSGPGKPLDVMMLLKSSTPADEVLLRARVLPSPNTRVLPFALAGEAAPWLWKLEVKPAQVWCELLVDFKAAPAPAHV